jgi:hypothetical protein
MAGGEEMSVEFARNDFIARVRQRHQGAAPKAISEQNVYVVHIARDNGTTEDLVFGSAPSIGAIAARVGTEAFVISTDVIRHRAEDHLAAE